MFKPVIGLEIHVQIDTESKIFCSCSTDSADSLPNTNICSICTGLPGVLPSFNEKVLRKSLVIAEALGCRINSFIDFDRKNYFYADLPKAYQITQFHNPLGEQGLLKTWDRNGDILETAINRIHMEEDAGKLIHKTENDKKITVADYNRAGIPLVEIVTEPCIENAHHAKIFLRRLRSLLRILDISQCNMEDGTLRCDANISISKGGEFPQYKCEIKNLNSFRFVEKALNYEISRQTKLLSENKVIKSSTLLWNEKESRTELMRYKETTDDYRYFREPDIPGVFTEEWKDEITIDHTPFTMMSQFLKRDKLTPETAYLLSSEKEYIDLYEESIRDFRFPEILSTWILGDIIRFSKKTRINIKNSGLTPSKLVTILKAFRNQTISKTSAIKILEKIYSENMDPEILINDKSYCQINDKKELKKIILEVINNSDKIVKDYINGKTAVFQFLTGQIMKKTSGRANPIISKQLLEDILKEKKNQETSS